MAIAAPIRTRARLAVAASQSSPADVVSARAFPTPATEPRRSGQKHVAPPRLTPISVPNGTPRKMALAAPIRTRARLAVAASQSSPDDVVSARAFPTPATDGNVRWETSPAGITISQTARSRRNGLTNHARFSARRRVRVDRARAELVSVDTG